MCCWKLTVNWKKDNNITICQYNVIVQFFWRCRVSLDKFNDWSKFYVNFMTGSGVMTIFIYNKGLTRNLEIGNTPSEFCPISEDWVKLGVPNLAWISNKKLLNAAKCQACSCYCFWVIRGKPKNGVKLPTLNLD